MRILYSSDHGPYCHTFIRQDVEAISKIHDTLYLAFETDKDYPNKKIKSKLLSYPSYSLESRIRWRFENIGLCFDWYNKAISSLLKKEIHNFNPDIIHCQFAYESAKLLHNLKIDKPVVLNFRGYDASYKLNIIGYVKWLRRILELDNIFAIFVSESLRENLRNKGVKIKNEPLILYTGIDLDKFKRTQKQKRENPIFIQVGSFNHKKGQEITIKSFEKFARRNPLLRSKLVLIGDGEKLDHCKKLASALHLNEQVEFLGPLDHADIIHHLNNASVFVHHSITAPNGDQEGIPNTILEAMAMELPILSTYHSGIPEAVEHGVNGFLCKENDIETYSKQMDEITNWGLLAKNREKVYCQFNIKDHLKKLLDFYSLIDKS